MEFLKDSRGINKKESLLQVLQGHSGTVTAVAFSPDGKVLASCSSYANVIMLWHTSTGELWRALEGHTSPVRTAVFSPDGEMVASGSEDETIKLWNTTSGELTQTLNSSSEIVGKITALAFSQDHNSIASASDSNKTNSYSITFWNIETGGFRVILRGPSNPQYQATFSPDGKWAVLVLRDENAEKDIVIRLLDMETRHHEPIFRKMSESFIALPAFSKDSKFVVAASTHRSPFLVQIQLWSREERKVQSNFKGQAFTTAIAFSPDQRFVASATSDANVEVCNITTGDKKHVFTGNDGWVTAVAFSPAGKVVAAGSGNGHVRLWDTTLDTSSIRPYEDRVNSVDVSPNGKLVASTSSDTTVRLWNVATGLCETILEGHTDRITTAVFSPDGELIASASCDNTIRLWDVRTRICRRHLKGHTNDVTAVCFSSDGMAIASASKDRTVRLWCTNKNWRSTLPTYLAPSKESIKTFEGHRLSVNAVSFSADGAAVVSASDDGTVRVWNIKTGSYISLTGENAQFVAVAFSINGRKVAAASADRKIWWWDADNGHNAGNMMAPGQYRYGHGMTHSEGAYYLKVSGCLRDGFSLPNTYGFWTFPFHENGEDWIKKNGERMLKPPEEYRANCLAMQGNMLVQGHRNGKATFLDLNSSSEE